MTARWHRDGGDPCLLDQIGTRGTVALVLVVLAILLVFGATL
jgi:hypothetical protein